MPKAYIKMISLSPRKSPSISIHDGNGLKVFEAINLHDAGGYLNRQWALEGTSFTIDSRDLKAELDQNIELLMSVDHGEEVSIPIKAWKNKEIVLRRLK